MTLNSSSQTLWVQDLFKCLKIIKDSNEILFLKVLLIATILEIKTEVLKTQAHIPVAIRVMISSHFM